MAHIAIDARIINSSTGRYVERLLTYLQKIDTTNSYTILVRKKDMDFWKPSNSNFSVVEADFADYSFAEQIGFKKLLDTLSPDLVHFCMPQQPVLYTGKHVTTIHDLNLLNTYNSDKNWLVFHSKQLVGKFVFRHVARSSDRIIVPSNYTKNDIISFAKIPADKVTLTYESADPVGAGSDTVEYPTGHKNFILYVGQQSDYKNIKRLGDAHQQLLSKYPDLGLLLVGKKNASSVKNGRYFAHRSYQNITFTGFVDNAQLAWLYSNAQAYVFPSLMEGFGLPGLEAMQYQTPVISSNATCLPEIYQNAAHYFTPTSVDSIAQAIDEVLRDPTLRNALITNGNELIKKYSWERMAQETLDVYQQVLAR